MILQSLPKKQYLLSIKKNFEQPIEKERSQSHNIFQLRGESNQMYHEMLGGPKYDKEGIIPRTIVGKTEQFQKMKDMALTSLRFTQPQISNQNPDKTLNRGLTRRISMMTLNSLKSMKSIKSTKSPTSQQSEEKRQQKKNKDFDIVDKQDLMKHIKLTRERIVNNEKLQLQQLRKMDLQKQLEETKDFRIIARFQEQQKIWDQQTQKLVQHTNRDVGDSIFYNSSSFRKKVEKVEYQEALQNQDGQQTVSKWYQTLRHNENETKQKFLSEHNYKNQVFQEIKNDFTSLIADQTLKPLEIIRKSSLYDSRVQKSKYSKDCSSNKLPFFKHTNVEEENLDWLQVEGTNVLDLESEFLGNCSSFSNQQFRFYKMPQQLENQDI